MNAADFRRTASESETQRAIVEALRYSGYLVLTTDRHRKGGGGGPDGISRGLPDLLVWEPERAGWMGLEVKRPSGGRLSPAQRALVDLGCVTVVRSVEEALAAMEQRKEGRR